jgi:SAM-dependent methyltransferase
MQPEAYAQLAQREDHHWWYRARRRLAALLLHHYGLGAGISALDIGCGCGGNLNVFNAFAPRHVVGLDYSPIALGIARRKAPDSLLIRADLTDPFPFHDGNFDVVTGFNVLYHRWVKDDGAVLKRIYKLLRPGGLFLATEPAFAFLRRGLDRVVMGQRRYTRVGFRRLAQSAGFEPLFVSYFFSFTFPAALVSALHDRLTRYVTGTSAEAPKALELKPLSTVVNERLFRLAAKEADLIGRGLHIPLGVTLIAVLRR